MSLTLALFLLYAMLQVGDSYTTVRGLKIRGNYERNIVMRWLMEKIGVVPALVVFKGLMVGVLFYILDETPWQVLAGLDVMYVYIIYKNWRVGTPKQG